MNRVRVAVSLEPDESERTSEAAAPLNGYIWQPDDRPTGPPVVLTWNTIISHIDIDTTLSATRLDPHTCPQRSFCSRRGPIEGGRRAGAASKPPRRMVIG